MLKQLIISPVLIFLFTTGTLFAQESTLTLVSGHEIVIDGTSNVRDWDARARTIQAELTLNGFDGESFDNLQPGHFQALNIRIPVEDIESDGRRLTNNIHDYLKKDDHPVINFTLNQIREIESSGDGTTIYADGVINAAGQDHVAAMTVNMHYDNGMLRFSGNQELKMTDFNIDPPRAMLGSIRAADEISIIYDVQFDR